MSSSPGLKEGLGELQEASSTHASTRTRPQLILVVFIWLLQSAELLDLGVSAFFLVLMSRVRAGRFHASNGHAAGIK